MNGDPMEDTKKAAAAISAVLLYMKTKEEAIAMQAQASGPAMPMVSRAPTQVIKPWALNGRQTQMQIRTLMQLKTFFKL